MLQSFISGVAVPQTGETILGIVAGILLISAAVAIIMLIVKRRQR